MPMRIVELDDMPKTNLSGLQKSRIDSIHLLVQVDG